MRRLRDFEANPIFRPPSMDDLVPGARLAISAEIRIVTATIEELRMNQGVDPHAAATAACQWVVASARKIRSVARETRWR